MTLPFLFVKMATDNEQLLLVFWCNRQRTKRLMQLTLITNQRREHRFWLPDILCKVKDQGAYYHLAKDKGHTITW